MYSKRVEVLPANYPSPSREAIWLVLIGTLESSAEFAVKSPVNFDHTIV
jgi:hypothetical protein